MDDNLKESLIKYIKNLSYNEKYNIIYIDGFYNIKTNKLEINFKQKIDIII
jgi:endonuclease III-like uncharacterized protein